MTIQEAIRSGKLLKRGMFFNWMRYKEGFLHWAVIDSSVPPCLSVNSLLATDWEVLVCEKHAFVTDHYLEAVEQCSKCLLEHLMASEIWKTDSGRIPDLTKRPKNPFVEMKVQQPAQKPTESRPKSCECGAEKCGFNTHADYCPKHSKNGCQHTSWLWMNPDGKLAKVCVNCEEELPI